MTRVKGEPHRELPELKFRYVEVVSMTRVKEEPHRELPEINVPGLLRPPSGLNDEGKRGGGFAARCAGWLALGWLFFYTRVCNHLVVAEKVAQRLTPDDGIQHGN